MKTRFWVTFEAEYSAAGTTVQKVRPINMTQTMPKNARGVPIAFEVDVPDEMFLGRDVLVSVKIEPPPATSPVVVAGSKWDEALKRQGVKGP